MEEMQMLQSLLDELINQLIVVFSGGQSISDRLQGLIADELIWLTSRIDELEQQIGSQPPPQGPDITQAMPSSNIEGFAYDDKTGRLLVRFLGDFPNREGPIYAYEGVPDYIFDLFQNGLVPAKTRGQNKWGKWWRGKFPSIGAAMYDLIKKGNYPYQRIS